MDAPPWSVAASVSSSPASASLPKPLPNGGPAPLVSAPGDQGGPRSRHQDAAGVIGEDFVSSDELAHPPALVRVAAPAQPAQGTKLGLNGAQLPLYLGVLQRRQPGLERQGQPRAAHCADIRCGCSSASPMTYQRSMQPTPSGKRAR